MGKQKHNWQDTEYVLGFFNEKISTARRRYRLFVKKGIPQGKRPELVGGGLIRSVGGWSAVKALRKAKSHQKGDERILGDGDFVEQVLAEAKENLDLKYILQSKGFKFNDVVKRVAEVMGIGPKEVLAIGKHAHRVRARSLLCYWTTHELGISQTYLAKRLKISQPAVSLAVDRGNKLAKTKQYTLI